MAERYLASLVRLWQAADAPDVISRALLEHPHIGERLAFVNAEPLFVFLTALTHPQVPTAADKNCTPSPSPAPLSQRSHGP